MKKTPIRVWLRADGMTEIDGPGATCRRYRTGAEVDAFLDGYSAGLVAAQNATIALQEVDDARPIRPAPRVAEHG